MAPNSNTMAMVLALAAIAMVMAPEHVTNSSTQNPDRQGKVATKPNSESNNSATMAPEQALAPALERSKAAIPENCMQMMLIDQLNGNTKWQDAEEHKLSKINTRFTLAMADVERKAWCKTVFRNSLFQLLGVRAHDFKYNDIIVALGLEGIETLDDFSQLTLE